MFNYFGFPNKTVKLYLNLHIQIECWKIQPIKTLLEKRRSFTVMSPLFHTVLIKRLMLATHYF